MQVVKIGKVHNSLRKALTGPNRIQKDKAVAQALTNVEEIRGVLTQGIGEEISKLHHLALRREEPVSDDTIEEGVALAGVTILPARWAIAAFSPSARACRISSWSCPTADLEAMNRYSSTPGRPCLPLPECLRSRMRLNRSCWTS